MQEIKIPEGYKATILGGVIRIEPIEPKFRRGDIVYCEYNEEDKLVSWITLVKKVLSLEPKDTKIDFHALYMISTNTRRVTPYLELDAYQSADCSVRLATPEEQQILFDALERKGKYWDAEALEVKDIPKEEMIKNIFRKLRGHNISVNEAYMQINNIIP